MSEGTKASTTAPTQVAARNRLLQKALREGPVTFPIEAEYPIVLAPDALAWSHAVAGPDGTPVAHANLWPRTLVDRTFGRSFPVALIGNVATDEAWRGKGLMRALFAHLADEARRSGLVAAFLWSDLHQFYQNLGFEARSAEWRYWVDRPRAAALAAKAAPLRWTEEGPGSLGLGDLARLNRLRHAADCTLAREPEEFARLLTIPETRLFVGWRRQAPEAYFVVGKGYDLGGVAHEWGAKDAHALLGGIAEVCAAFGLGELLVLCPGATRPTWRQAFRAASRAEESHPMAFAAVYAEAPGLRDALARTFIWGLDSI